MKFADAVLRTYPTGSRYICNPPPQDTDNDTVILVNGYYSWADALIAEGWEYCNEYEKIGLFSSFRKGEENYIVTEDPLFYWSYVKATEGAKALNLLNKDDRIKLFQAVELAGSNDFRDEGGVWEMWKRNARPQRARWVGDVDEVVPLALDEAEDIGLDDEPDHELDDRDEDPLDMAF